MGDAEKCEQGINFEDRIPTISPSDNEQNERAVASSSSDIRTRDKRQIRNNRTINGLK